MKSFMSFLAYLVATVGIIAITYYAANDLYDSVFPFVVALLPLYTMWFGPERKAWEAWQRAFATLALIGGVYFLTIRFDPALPLWIGALTAALIWNRR